MNRPTAAAVLLFCLATVPLAAQSPRPLPAQPGPGRVSPPRAEAVAPSIAPADDQSAEVTREQLTNILEQYPPSLPQVLRLDPSLLTNGDYLALYPALSAFLARHPEIGHNPSYFLGAANFRGGFPPDSRSQTVSATKDVLGAMLFLMGFSLVVTLAASGVKMFIEHRRWLRVSKIQTDVHAKLLDRLTSNEDLLAYIQSPAGRQFLDAAPIPNPARQSLSAPVNRILWSVQAGVILALGGAGLWYARRFVIEDVAQPLAVMGSLSVFLGAGFVLSSFVAYALSKMLGLFEAPALRPHA